MTKKSINVTIAMKEATELRISPDVVEEVTHRLRTELIPALTRALAVLAKEDQPSRKTIQDKDCSFFDYRDWWRLLVSDFDE